jgi:hypothetical protein
MSQTNRPLMLHSGADRADYLRLLAKEQSAALIHAKDARRPKLLAMLQVFQQQHHMVYALDCGYKKKLTLEQYALLLTSLQEHVPTLFAWYASQDEIADQVTSDVNYEKLLSLCSSFQEKIVWIYQMRWGSRRERAQYLQCLEAMCQKLAERKLEGRLIGLGGIVPIIKRSTTDALQVLQEVGEILNAFSPWVQAHVFGPASHEILFYLRTQPWVASIDSSKWLVGLKAWEVLLWSGEQVRATALRLLLTPEECASINIRVLNSWVDQSQDVHQASLWTLPALDQKSVAAFDQLRSIRRFFVRQRGRSTQLFWVRGGEKPKRVLYLPLFTSGACEYGLISHTDDHSEREPTITETWAVVWDVSFDESSPALLFMLDGKLKTGHATHGHPPRLCYYPFSTATTVAKSFRIPDQIAA